MYLYEQKLLAQDNLNKRETAKISLNDRDLKISVLELSEQDDETYELKAESSLALGENDYTSYYFVLVEKYNKVEGKFIRVHPFTFASKSPLNLFDEFLLGSHVTVYFQIDTGLLAEGDAKLAIKTLRIPTAQIDQTGFGSCNLIQYEDDIVTPRKTLWDRYALQIGDQIMGCDNKGAILLGSALEVPQTEFFDIEIHKYTPDFATPLTREIDHETVCLETTAGVLNTSRIALANGCGKFRLYPMGYQGEFKLKVGWRYFSGWSEYKIVVKEQP